MLPLSLPDPITAQADGTATSMVQVAAGDDWDFAEIFSLIASTATNDDSVSVPALAARTAEAEPSLVDDTSENIEIDVVDLPPAQLQTEAEDPLIANHNQMVEPTIVKSKTKQAPSEPKQVIDVVDTAVIAHPQVIDNASKSAADAPAELSNLHSDGNSRHIVSSTQSVLEGRMSSPTIPKSNPVPKTSSSTVLTPRATPPTEAKVPSTTRASETSTALVQPLDVKAQVTRSPLAKMIKVDWPEASEVVLDKSGRNSEAKQFDVTKVLAPVPANGAQSPQMVKPNLTIPPQQLDLKSQGKIDLPVDADPLLSAGERIPASLQMPTAAPTSAGVETVRHAANQIAVVINRSSGQATEIALNPEELGRVRLSMTTVDTSVTLTVLAERPETHDLLRRHIDVLAEEFKSLGYENISFSFSDDQTDTDGAADDTTDQVQPMDIDLADSQHQTQQHFTQGGLDLRM